MSCRVFYCSLLALSLTACGSVNNKQAQGSFDYQNQPEADELIIPDNLSKPKQKNDYFITNKVNHLGPVGENMDIRAPSLVMPVAASSRVVEESGIAIIWFDKVLEDKDLLSFIEKVVKDKLTEDGISFDYVEEDTEETLGKVIEGAVSLKETSIKREGIKTAILESGWYHNEVETGWVFTDIEYSKSIRFRYQLLAKSHGRSVSLRVSLIDFLETDERGGNKIMDPIDKQRAEKAMLNELIAGVDYNYRVQQRENRLIRANQKLVTFGKNIESEDAYVIEMELEDLWGNMPVFFEKHGFYFPYASYQGGVAHEPWHLSYMPLAKQYQEAFNLEKLAKTLKDSNILGKEVILSNLPFIAENYINNISIAPSDVILL